MRQYSHFFQTLHDEQEPVGYLGRGTHCTVLRAVVFHDEDGGQLSKAKFCDFVVVWDEDHDERIIEVIEKIYLDGALASFIAFGERKGCLTAVMADKPADKSHLFALSKTLHGASEAILREAASDVDGDAWSVKMTCLDSTTNPLIADAPENVVLYLRNLHMLWHLGIKSSAQAGKELSKMSITPSAFAPLYRTA